MRHLILILFLITAVSGFSQFDKSISLRTTGNFNVALGGLGVDDAGVGFGLDASFLSKHRLQAIVETSLDHFFGDKSLYIDRITGKDAKTNIYSIKAGPQFFITRNLALSATYGPTWYKVRDFDYTRNYGFKYSITGFFGERKRFIAKVFMVNIPAQDRKIQYLGFAAGFTL